VARLAAIDALGRGLANARANWELLLAQLAAVAALVLLVAASVVPLVLAFGMTLAGAAATPLDLLGRLTDPALWLSTAVLAALAGATLLSGLAVVVYSWFQAGIFGVLVAGDRQAGPGPRRPSALYRNFTWSDFAGWAGRGVWRLFGWYHVYLMAITLLVALIAALVAVAIQVGIGKGAAAGLGIGCGGALPLAFVLLFAGLVFEAAKADVMRDGSGAVASWRRGGAVVSRRLGGSLLLFLLMACASLAVSVVVAPLQIFAELGLKDFFGAYLGLQILVTVVQTVAATALGVVFGAAWVALVRAEISDPA
jgi:hypothetical protein